MKTPIEKLEQHTKSYAAFLDRAAALNVEVRQAVGAAIAPFLADINEMTTRLAAAEQEIKCLIKDNPELFVKPKTLVINGVKVGVRKQKGKLVIEDSARTIALIKKHYHDDIGALVKTTETPVKPGLEKLPANELKRLGVQLTDDTDAVVFDVVQDDIDALFGLLNNITVVQEELAA